MGLIYFISFFTLIAAILLIWALVQLQHNSNQQMETT
jgi:uncharacterized membrane protein